MKQISRDLIVVVSQHKTVQYIKKMLESLQQNRIPFSTLIVFDGTTLVDRGILNG